MDAIFIDSNGNKKNFLWQYDKGQTLVLENLDYDISPKVHFATSLSKEALVVTGTFKNNTLTVNVPDALLLNANKINVYLYINNSNIGETIKALDIFVRPRQKPDNYIYTDGMYIVSIGSITNAIDTYVDANQEAIGDIIINYTSVCLTDDATGKKYMVGINNSQLYIKEVI